MPIFEYRCKICGNEFEVLIRSSESKVSCPDCAAENVTKKFSTFGFISGNSTVVASGAKTCGGCASHNCGGCHH
ncbi:MAG: hypothetical protein A2W25_07425 [candidate division Zixibacteria bacterium RBG_16_53_22]|nr:MAG: hypothetical protein A2W25_07425 [candidate division Zixibacteria bacterium RBG_16_53_22]